MRICTFVLSIQLAVLTLCPASARGDNESDAVDARKSFARGEELFAAGEYQAAATHYLKAYNRVPRPKLLFNAAQAYRLAGMRDAAIAHFRRFLAAEPTGKISDIAKQHLDQLMEQRRASTSNAAVAEQPATPEKAVSPGRTRRILGHVAVATAALAGAGAVVFAVRARSLNDEVVGHREGAWTDALLDKRDAAEDAQRNAIIGGSVAGVAAVAAVLLYWSGSHADDRKQRASLAPLWGAHAVGAAVDFRF